MGFIKLGYNDNGEVLCTLCSGKPDSPEFFYTDDKGICKQVKNSMIIEFNQENLKKMMEIFNND